MGRKKRKEEIDTGPAGGIFFFASLLSLIFLACVNSIALPGLVSTTSTRPLFYFTLSAAVGASLAYLLIRGHISVFIHEFKHSLMSHFAGNKGKEMRVRQRSGHFRYEYSKETAHFNAFISLAPYWVPLFTAPSIGVAYLLLRSEMIYMITLVGVAYGMDLLLNLRDISRHQSDLTNIRGGYFVALTYIASMNVTILSILLAWVLQGPPGLYNLAAGIVRAFAVIASRIGQQ